MTPNYTIYALLIGINNYPNPGHRLKGCVADVEAIHDYLQTFCSENQLELKVLILTDEAATRDEVIKGFEHFQAATDNDFCLFHYSGHGSRSLAPREFLHLESDGYIESLVCHDSRTVSRDLMNKELSWLIWNATKGKPNVSFINIMDCCHSGKITRTRAAIQEEQQTRTVGESDKKFKANTILGFEDYKVDEDSRYTPPIGRQVLLAASREKQTAKEVKVKGVKRGIFTYFIIDELKQHNGKLTYLELINRVGVPIQNYVNKQIPQIVATVSSDKRNYFLSKEIASNQNTCLLSWNKKLKAWCVNIGAIQGVSIGIENELPEFRLLKSNVIIESSAVHANYTVMNISDTLDKEQSYKVEQVLENTLVYINHQNDSNIALKLSKTISEDSSFFIELTDDITKANYQIIIQNNEWFFQFCNKQPAFSKTIFSVSENLNDTKIFLNKIAIYFNWLKVLRLNNPNSNISKTALNINFNKNNETVVIENNQTAVELTCQKENGKWQIPTFQLKISNNNSQSFWVSVCYLGADYSIQNDLVDIQELSIARNVNALQVDNNSFLNENIELSIPKEILEKEAEAIKVYLKIFIGKQAFSTDVFNQKGIYDKTSVKRFTKDFTITPDDWTTKEILIKLKKTK